MKVKRSPLKTQRNCRTRPELKGHVEPEPSLLDEEDGGALEEEQREEPTIKHYRLLTPLSSRNQREVMAVFVDMYLRLRAEGKYNSYTPTSPENSGQQP